MLEIGDTLREARQQRGIELADAEAATLIRARYLEALEDEHFELLPVGSYRRTFLREYADYLGVGGATLAAEYDLRFPPPVPEPPPAAYQQALLDLGNIPLRRTLAVVAVLVLVGVGVWQLGKTPNLKAPPAPAPTTPAAAAHRGRVHTASPPARPAARSRPTPTPKVLVLTATAGNCWVLVRVGSANGRTVYERTLRRGQTLRLGLRKPLWIELGAPSTLKATIGRHPVSASLPRQTGTVVASAAGLRPAA